MEGEEKMSQSIVESIKDFIKQEETNYALLLNGAWGSGKTYFWENNLVGEIKKIPAIKNESDKKYKTVYVSLYGLSSIIDVEKKILLNLYLNKNKILKNEKVAKWASMLLSGFKEVEILGVSANSFKQEKIEIPELINLNDVVLCFDDLERSSIPINDLMGFINELVEHGRAKVIIIANEEEIDNKETYKKIKEKVIGRTLLYKPDYTGAVKQIVSSVKNGNCKEMLHDNLELIEQLFHSSDTNNIRILKQIIYDFEIIYNKVKEHYPDISEKVVKEILRFTFATSFEIRSGVEGSNNLESIESDKDFFFRVRLKDKGESSFWKYLKKFDEKYFLKENNIRFFKFIVTFVSKGIFDKETFDNEMDRNKKNSGNDDLEYNTFLANEYWHYSDKDFEQLSRLTFEKLQQGDLSVYTYFVAYTRFEELINLKLFDKSIEELKEAILTGLDKAKGKSGYHEGVKETLLEAEKAVDGNKKLILDKLFSIIDELKIKKEKQEIVKMLQLINVGIHVFGKTLNDEYHNTPILNVLELKQIKGTILNLENDDLYHFIGIMRKRYGDSLNERFVVEIPALKEIQSEIEGYIEGKKITPKVILLRRLVDYISNITK